jgi:predicted lipoprotein with Yx(FWY)xxD motif
VRRILILIAATAVATSLTSTLASASANRAKLQLRQTSAGKILVNGRGFTLYTFTKDARNKDACASISGCPSIWPVLKTGGKPIAGRGVKSSLIGTITTKSGAKQVTYAGHPLYLYSGDSGPGQTAYINFQQFGGRWPAVNAAGREVK